MGGRKQYFDPCQIYAEELIFPGDLKKKQLKLSIPMQPKTLMMSRFWIG
jgi:hypothetical protein